MIETGSEYQLLQHFEAIPVNPSGKKTDESAVNIESDVLEPKPIVVAVDGSKFEAFFDAIVNLIIIIPVKYARLIQKKLSLLLLKVNDIFLQRIHISSASGSSEFDHCIVFVALVFPAIDRQIIDF